MFGCSGQILSHLDLWRFRNLKVKKFELTLTCYKLIFKKTLTSRLVCIGALRRMCICGDKTEIRKAWTKSNPNKSSASVQVRVCRSHGPDRSGGSQIVETGSKILTVVMTMVKKKLSNHSYLSKIYQDLAEIWLKICRISPHICV